MYVYDFAIIIRKEINDYGRVTFGCCSYRVRQWLGGIFLKKRHENDKHEKQKYKPEEQFQETAESTTCCHICRIRYGHFGVIAEIELNYVCTAFRRLELFIDIPASNDGTVRWHKNTLTT